MRIRTKLIFAFLAIAMLTLLVGIFAIIRLREDVEVSTAVEAQDVAETIAYMLSSSPEMVDGKPLWQNPAALQARVQGLQRLGREIEIVDPQQRMLASLRPGTLGQIYSADARGELSQSLADGQVRTFMEVGQDKTGETSDIVVPLKSADGQVLGAVIVGYSSLFEQQRELSFENARVIAAVMALSGALAILLGIFVTGNIDHSLRAFQSAARAVARGDTAVRLPIKSRDEIGAMAEAFNRMAADLGKSRAGLEREAELLAASEATLRGLFAAMTDVVLVLDRDGRYLQIAPTNPALLFRPPAELLGRTMHEVLPAAHADNILCTIRLALERQQPVHVEYSLPIAGGEVWFDGTVSPLGQDRIFWIARDISESKHAQEQLRQSEQKYRYLFEHNPNCMWVYAEQTLEFLAVNEAAVRQYGYSRDEYARMTLKDIRPASELPKLMDLLGQDRPGMHRSETRHRRKDGSLVDVEAVSEPIEFEGRAARLVQVTDVSERKRAKAQSAAFAQLGHHLSAAKTARDAARIIVGVADQLFAWDACTFDLYSAERDVVQSILYMDTLAGQRSEVLAPAVERSPNARQRQTIDGGAQHVLKEDLSQFDSLTEPFGDESRPSAAIMLVPIRHEAKVIGLLSIQSYTPVAYDPAMLETLQALADHCAGALDRIKVQEDMLAGDKRFRSLIEKGADAIALISAEGAVTYTGPSTQRVLGYCEDEFLGRNVFALIHPDDQQTSAALFAGLFQEPGKSVTAECRVLHRDGSWRWIETTGTNLLAEPAVRGIVANLRDVTERKRADERTQQHLSRLAALRSIDQAISSSLDLRVTLGVLLEQVTRQLHVDAAEILLLSPHMLVLEYAAARGFRSRAVERTRIRLGEGYAGRVAVERRMLGVPDMRHLGQGQVRGGLLDGEDFVAYCGVPLLSKGEIKGVLGVFHRAPLDPDEEWEEFLVALAGQAAIAIDNAQLFRGLQRSNVELTLAYDTTLEGWSRALDLRDKETEGHTQRVTELTMRLAGATSMSAAEMVHVRRGALLHDIGKMGVPDSILLKPGPLTDEEWVSMRKHPTYAYEMLLPIAYLRPALDIPYCHHEKWDGTGYPRGLSGEQIPLAARIFAVVDVWDALRSDRPYRKAWSDEKVREHIRSLSATHFDPQVVDAFLNMADMG